MCQHSPIGLRCGPQRGWMVRKPRFCLRLTRNSKCVCCARGKHPHPCNCKRHCKLPIKFGAQAYNSTLSVAAFLVLASFFLNQTCLLREVLKLTREPPHTARGRTSCQSLGVLGPWRKVSADRVQPPAPASHSILHCGRSAWHLSPARANCVKDLL